MNYLPKLLKPASIVLSQALLLILMILLLSACGDNPTATPVPLPTATPSPAPTATPLPTATPSPAPTATATAAPTSTTAATTVNSAAATVASGPTATVSPAVLEALQKAATVNSNLNTIHFAIQVLAGKAIIEGSEMREVTGDAKRDEGFQSVVKVNAFLGASITVEFVEVDKQQYTTNPITGGWIKVSPERAIKLNLLDPKDGIGGVISNLRNPKLVGSENLNGVDTLHYQGVASGKTIAPLTINTLGKHDVTLDIWIGAKDNFVYQINLKEIDGDGEWTIKFSRFNEAVELKRPKV